MTVEEGARGTHGDGWRRHSDGVVACVLRLARLAGAEGFVGGTGLRMTREMVQRLPGVRWRAIN